MYELLREGEVIVRSHDELILRRLAVKWRREYNLKFTVRRQP
jgi:hypothetical protein